MDALRKPFFFFAILTMALVVIFEIAALGYIQNPVATNDATSSLTILYLALVDGALLYTIIWMGIALLPQRFVISRVQTILTLVLSFFSALGTIALVFITFGLIMLMVGLLLAIPFGTIAYFIKFADFPADIAVGALSFIMLLKLFFVVFLALAHQGFLKNKSIIILIALSLGLTWFGSFLIAFPPSFLASITDAVAALIIAVIAFVRFVLLCISSSIGIVRSLKIKTVPNQR